MLAIMQTSFTGIDALTTADIPVPALTPNGVLIKMHVLPVVPTDWKREANPHATAEQAAQLPRIIGVGGAGQVVAVGANRDPALLHQRVLVMQPSGSYSAYLLSENPDFIFPLPTAVSDASAAALTAGPGTARVLQREISASTATNVVVTGANSVIGLYLLQLLRPQDKHIWPIVSPASQAYFQTQCPDYPAVTAADLPPLTTDTLVIDIAGSEPLLNTLTAHLTDYEIVSIALTQATLPLKFVHESFNPADYRQFIADLATGDLHAPIARTFAVRDTIAAQHYACDHHSRGRVLVTFD